MHPSSDVGPTPTSDNNPAQHGAGERQPRRSLDIDYDKYERHQASKMGNATKRTGPGMGKIANFDKAHGRQLLHLLKKKPEMVHSPVLCVGARLGSEVQAFQALKHVDLAIGVDFNPGERNPLVMWGDAHKLDQFKPGSFGTVYTNILDHVAFIPKFRDAVHRILRPGGTLWVDMINQTTEDKWAVRNLAEDRIQIEQQLQTVFNLAHSSMEMVGRTVRRALFHYVFEKRS